MKKVANFFLGSAVVVGLLGMFVFPQFISKKQLGNFFPFLWLSCILLGVISVTFYDVHIGTESRKRKLIVLLDFILILVLIWLVGVYATKHKYFY